jgi:hypothetical protein
MSATHSTRWFWSDWLGDQAVRRLSLAERGLWIDLLALAAAGNPTGYVCDAQGRPLTLEEIARVANAASPDEVAKLIVGIVEKGAASRDRAGRLFNRRMVRDAVLSVKRREAGRQGAARTNSIWQENPDLPRQVPRQTPQQSGKGRAAFSHHDPPLPHEGEGHEADCARASGIALSETAFLLAEDLHAALGWDKDDPRAIGSAYTAQKWLNGGWNADLCLVTARRLVAAAGKPIKRLGYFEDAIAEAHADFTAPLPATPQGNQRQLPIIGVVPGGKDSYATSRRAGAKGPGGFARNFIDYVVDQAGEHGSDAAPDDEQGATPGALRSRS